MFSSLGKLTAPPAPNLGEVAPRPPIWGEIKLGVRQFWGSRPPAPNLGGDG